jgi:hypothetical protein
MAKQVVYIGVAVATDGILPERSSIYNITACCGDAYQFTVNVLPKDGEYKQSTFWTKHQDVFNTFRARAVPLEEAMTLFRTWLKQFQGQLVACGSTVDHWHLLTAFLATGKDCPFGSLPIDSATLAMKVRGERGQPP